MKILFFGDIVGKTGRLALKSALEKLRSQYSPDFVVVNGENATHGKGIGLKAYEFFKDLNIDCITSGDHIFDLTETMDILNDSQSILIRPANYPKTPDVPGQGFIVLEKNNQKLGVVNLQGRVFMKEGMDNPFTIANEILADSRMKNIPIFVDFHTEATSEIGAMGWHLDGRVSAVVGTHTHVPTADAKVLPKGTAFISDVGMVGSKDSILGDQKEGILRKFRTGLPFKLEVGDMPAVANAVLIEYEGTLANSIVHIAEAVA